MMGTETGKMVSERSCLWVFGLWLRSVMVWGGLLSVVMYFGCGDAGDGGLQEGAYGVEESLTVIEEDEDQEALMGDGEGDYGPDGDTEALVMLPSAGDEALSSHRAFDAADPFGGDGGNEGEGEVRKERGAGETAGPESGEEPQRRFSTSFLPQERLIALNQAATDEQKVMLKLQGVREHRGGDVCVAVFDDQERFLDTSQAVVAGCFQPHEDRVVVYLPEAGEFAFSVLHDQDQDGELSQGWFGIPTEGFGFSNNPRVGVGAPDYEDVAVVIDRVQREIVIEMRYLF